NSLEEAQRQHNDKLKKLEDMEKHEMSIERAISSPFWNYLSIGVGFVLFALSVGIALRYSRKGYTDLQQVKQKLEEQLNDSTQRLNAQIEEGGRQRRKVNEDLKKQLSDKIQNIDEVVHGRNILNGFADIFKKAEEMLQESNEF